MPYPLRLFAHMMFVVMLLSVPASASATDSIDQALDDCLGRSEGGTTMGQVECLSTAYKAWDKELNSVYATLTQKLDVQSRTLLRDAQRKWLAYRDADFVFQGGPWSQDKGTMMHVILNSAAVDRVRSRATALRDYLAVYE
jgi:uncharacterized protein YecT (DUF1311 family)